MAAAISTWTVRLCCWLLAAVFLTAGIAKLLSGGDFVLAVWNFELLSMKASKWVAMVLPWIEIALGVWLLVPWQRTLALVASGLLLLFFSAVLFSALWRGIDIACGCFGSEASEDASGDLILALGRNTVLLGLVVAAIFLWQKKDTQEPVSNE